MRAALAVCVLLLLSGCASGGGGPGATELSWEEALEVLATGEVETVAQYHSLLVILEMKDGRRIETREPRIDLIFDAVEECGAPCADIALVTE